MAYKEQPAAEKPTEERSEVPPLPPGVKLVRTLRGHTDWIGRIAWSPDGRLLASPSADKTIRLWEAETGQCLRTLTGHRKGVITVAFDPTGGMLASASDDESVKLWDAASGQLLRSLEGHWGAVKSVVFDPTGRTLASASDDESVKLWDAASGRLLRSLEGRSDSPTGLAFDRTGRTLAGASWDWTVKLWETASGRRLPSLKGHSRAVNSIAFDPAGRTLASASWDQTVRLWDAASGGLLRSLEGHTSIVNWVGFSADGRLLASKGSIRDSTIRLWRHDTGACVATIPEPASPFWPPGLAFHPHRPQLATVGTDPGAPEDGRDRVIHIWELDFALLLGGVTEAVHHTTGKIVLLGDHSVGKSALGHRLIHDEFKEQKSTHGQQFWVFPALGKRRTDGTECEAILWDFAGQPDYRLVHALFVDDADLVLVLFDASDLREPLHGVEFWLKQLNVGQASRLSQGQPGAQPDQAKDHDTSAGLAGRDRRDACPTILVAAQTDRGSCSLTPEELKAFCEKHGIVGPIVTSALTGEGVADLIERMKSLIPWEDKPATVTTTTFKRIKDYILGLKGNESESDGRTVVTSEQLRERLEQAFRPTAEKWHFSDAEMLTAVGHLENYGYVRRLRTSKGEVRVLLEPERLNNLASSFVLEARRNPKGLGALEETRLLTGGYKFQELQDLGEEERDVLLDSAALLFLEHNVCFRETDPLRREPYLVFPELINLKKPAEEDQATEEGVAYTVSGPTENVFASLVVLLGYTHTFTRTKQWQNHARYEVGNGLVCGFRQEPQRDGELDFVLCFAPNVGQPVRTLFQGLFESFLARRNLTVMRHEPVRCGKAGCGRLLDRAVVRQRLKEGKTFAFCNECGEKLTLPKPGEPIQLSREVEAEIEEQRQVADQRTRFEQAVFQVQAYVAEQKIKPPECFISYAWGVPEHERWVEKRLATDLQKAGIKVVLDRWENPPGSSIQRFLDRLEKVDRIVVVGTELYRHKYDNEDPKTGTVVAAECGLIAKRMRGPEQGKRTVVPLLLEGDAEQALPPCLHDQVFSSFRDGTAYFQTAFDLILSLYQIPPNDPAVADLREGLQTAAGRGF